MSWSPAGKGVALWRRRILRAKGVSQPETGKQPQVTATNSQICWYL